MGVFCCKQKIDDQLLTLVTGPTLETLGTDTERDTHVVKAGLEEDGENKIQSMHIEDKNLISIKNEKDEINPESEQDKACIPNGINDLNDNQGQNKENTENNVKNTENEDLNRLNKNDISEPIQVIPKIEITEEMIKKLERQKTKRNYVKNLETELEEKKLEVLERESFNISLLNLDEINHNNVEFTIEVLFS